MEGTELDVHTEKIFLSDHYEYSTNVVTVLVIVMLLLLLLSCFFLLFY